MSVLDRKLHRELRGHAGMLLAVTSIIAVGVACMVTLASSYRNLSEAKKLYYAQCQMADFSIELKKVPLSELDQIAAWPEVAAIRPRIQQYVAVDLEGVSEPLNGLALSLPDRRQPVIDDIAVRQGGYFTDRRDNEVIVNEAFARYHRLRPGQWIKLILNNQQQELFVVGTSISSEFVYLLGAGTITPDPKRFGVFYLKQSFAEEVFDFKGSANQVLGRLSAAARGNPKEVLRRAEQRLSDYGVFTTTPLEDQMSNKFLSQEIKGLESFAVVTPTMFLAVAALVLNVLLTRIAQQQRTVIGTLKALGYSDMQVFWHFLKFGLSVGATGGLIGCALGWWMASGMTRIYQSFFQFPELENRFHWSIHLTGLGVSAGCAVLGCFRGSKAVLKLRPAAAMRPNPPRSGKTVVLERIGWLWKALSTRWRMVLRNLLRNRLRTLAGIFGAAMGGSVLVNGFMMEKSTQYFLDFQFEKVLRSDYDLLFKDERGREALDEAAKLPGVDRAEPMLDVSCTFSNGSYRKKGSITGLLAHAQLTVPRDLDGRPVRIPAHGLAMTRIMAEHLHLKVGDRVIIEPIKGEKIARTAPVVEIADSYLGTAVYAEIHYLSRLVGEEFAVSGVQVLGDGNPRHREAFFREIKQMPALQSIAGRKDMVRTLQETLLDNQRVIIDIILLFSGIVFFGSILNSSLVSLAERQRELATLRVLGYGPWEIGGLLFRESAITTLIGTILGMPLGYLLTRVTAAAYASDMFRFPIITTADIWLWTLAYAAVFALLTQLAVQRAVHKMDWLDALKVQE
ncbi:MAG: FtsX-like permease family protein [Pirellulales bacterium]|nr:FtsX-like permease family protein [Pirellulales bacterium]